MPDINNADDAVNAALDAENNELAEIEENAEETVEEVADEGDAPEENVLDESEEETEEEEKPEPVSYGLPDEQVKQAVQLFKAISGQNSAEAIKAIARQAGIELAEDKTTEESAEPSISDEDIKGILEGELGQFKFLAGPISKALQKIADRQNSSITKVKQDISAQEVKRGITEEIKDYCAKNGLNDDLGKDPVSAEIFKLSKQFPFQGTDRKEFRKYFGDLHTFALAKLGKSKPNGVSPNKNDKIKSNLASREASAVGNTGRKLRKPAPANLTAEDAVAAAMRGEFFE